CIIFYKKLSNAKFNTYFTRTPSRRGRARSAGLRPALRARGFCDKKASKLINSLEELSSFNDQEPPSDGPGERENKPSFPYKTLIVNAPIANREQILSHAESELGVYHSTNSKSLDTTNVVHSVSLYTITSSYFMPYILTTTSQTVLSSFNKYGFSQVHLTTP